MKHVIVTGAAGLLGRHVVAAFRDAGFRVTGFDLQADAETGVIAADLTDLDGARSLIRDADCVAHIASLPRPVGYAAKDVFLINMTLMFNVQTAMEENGLRRLLFASSFSVLGLPFAPMPVALQYLPVDDHHPAQPQDVYAVTKWLGEEMVEAWVKRGGGTAVSIRMPWIQTAATFPAQVAIRRQTEDANLDLWAYIDARDAAHAFVLAADAPTAGHERLFISANDSYSETPTEDLVGHRYAGLPRRAALEGHASLISNDKAKALLGFSPQYSWRDYPDPGSAGTIAGRDRA